MRIQPARRQHDIQVGGVGSGSGNQSTRPLDLSLAQGLLLSSVAGYNQPVLGHVALNLAFGVIDHDKRNGLPRQFPRHAAPYPANAADNVVAFETTDLAIHAPPSKEALQFKF